MVTRPHIPPSLPPSFDASARLAREVPRYSWIGLCLLFVAFSAIGVVLFYPGMHSRMIYDSKSLMEANALVFSRGDLLGVMNIVPQRPLFMISLYVNYVMTGMDPFSFRLFNIAILAASGVAVAVLIFVLLDAAGLRPKTTRLQQQYIGILCGLCFVVHPLQCFVVLYTWQRSAIMACLFYFSALAVYVAGRSGLLHRPARWYAATSLLFFAGMLSKENVATFPLVALLTEIILFRQDTRQLFRHALAIAGITGPPLFATFILTYVLASPQTAVDQRGIVERVIFFYGKAGIEPLEVLLTECRVLFSYLFVIVAPFFRQLQLLKAEIVSRSLLSPPVTLAAVAGVVGLVAAAVACLRRKPLICLGILFFLVSLVPESFLIPQYLFFGHRPILPMIGVLMVLADVLATMLTRPGYWARQLAVLAPLLVVACLSFTTFSQAGKWNPFLFWQDAYARLPEYSPDVEPCPYVDVVCSFASQLTLRGRYKAAIPLFEKAMEPGTDRKSDKQALAMVNLGIALIRTGNTEEGIRCLREVVDRYPRGSWPRYNLGVALINAGKKDEGMRFVRGAVELNPDDIEARLTLGDLLCESGAYDEAIKQYAAALKSDPRSGRIYNLLGKAWEKTGNLGSAIENLQKAVQLNQESPEFRVDLGRALAAAGNKEEALAVFNQALAIKPGHAAARYNSEKLQKLFKNGP